MNNRIELRHLRYFLAVAQDLHFGRAADRLFISQPGLSRQIKQLEEILGIQLFVRSSKTVFLTSAGEYLKNEVLLNLSKLDNIIEYTKLLDQGVIGKIKFGYVGSAMQDVIPSLIVNVKKLHNDIQFNLKEMEIPRQINSLLSLDIDVGFLRLTKVPASLVMLPVIEEYFSLALPLEHPVDVSNFKDLSQFKEDPFIFIERDYSPEYFDQIMSIFNDHNFNPIVSHTSVHASSIFKMVENNLGIALIPSSLTKGFDMKVKFIELRNIPQRTVISAVWNKENRNPILPIIIEFLS